jgi:hypothetical protein
VELLRTMGYEAPRRVLAGSLAHAATINGPPPGGRLATEPAPSDRLAALGPLEAARLPARRPRPLTGVRARHGWTRGTMQRG